MFIFSNLLSKEGGLNVVYIGCSLNQVSFCLKTFYKLLNLRYQSCGVLSASE